MKKFLGLICIIYSVVIGYVWIFDKLKYFLAPNMQIYLKLSLIPLLIMGIILLKEKKDKFKISDLILLLPIIMIIISSDGKLSTNIAVNRTSKPKITKKVNVKETKEKEDDEEIEIDKDNLEIHFDVIDENYMDLATYITFLFENYNQYQNKTIRVKGLALKNIEDTPKGYVQLGRYAITCCAADASFASFYVKDEEGNIKDNTWYEVEGILKKSTYDYINIMYIKVINIKEIDTKNDDYVYPCYSYDDGQCNEFKKYNLKY